MSLLQVDQQVRRERFSSAEDPIPLLRHAAESAIGYVEALPSRPVRATASARQLRETLDVDLPEALSDPMRVLDHLTKAVEPGLLPTTSGRFFGYVVGGALPIAVATEWLTTVWDQCAVNYAGSPAAAITEEACARWLIDLFGLPAHVSTGFMSGCQAANLTGLAAARRHVLGAIGWDVEAHGLCGAPAPRVLVSDGCHATVLRALRLLGLGGQIHRIPVDARGKMAVDELAKTIDATSGPLIVCAQVGSTDTGSIDPLPEICELAHAHDGWVHVDAAFGMWAAASPKLRDRVRGLELADSWATDAHKWLNVPYDSGIAFCAHPAAHRAALALHADYISMREPERQRDPMDWTPELSRRARSFVLWATLRTLGRSGVAELVERCHYHARYLAARLRSCPGIIVLNDITLNQVLVRFADPSGREDDRHTNNVIEHFQCHGAGWASGTRWLGQTALRLSVCNWSTTIDDINACAESLINCHHAAGVNPDIRHLTCADHAVQKDVA